MSKGPSTESKPKASAPKRDVRQAAAPQRANTPQRSALLQRALDDPALLSQADVGALQRQYGNSAVAGLLSRRASGMGSATTTAAPRPFAPAMSPDGALPAPAVQRAADQNQDEEPIIEAEPGTAPDTQAALGSSNPEDDETISRMADPLAAETRVEDEVQRATQSEEDDAVQRKPDAALTVGLAGGPVDDGVERQIQSERGVGRPLPGGVRARVEGALDADLGSVRVHTGQTSDTLNRSLGARAFTTGSDIFFKDGEYDPASRDGQTLLAHELTHVVQQGAAVRRRHQRVQRASSVVAQREVGAVAGAYANQRREWKDMSTLGKMAMVPGGALYGAGQAAAGTYGGIYNRLAGENAGTGRRIAAGVASGIAGTVALPFALAGGALRGLFQGIANPIHSIGKRIGGAAASVPGRARGAIGNYGGDLSRDQNLLGSTTGQIANYGVTATGAAATGARAGLDIASRAESGNVLNHDILTQSQISGAGTAFGVLGAGAGILGAGAAVMDTVSGARETTRAGLAGSSRALAAGQTLSSAGEAVKQSSMAAYNIASLVDAQGVAAAGAQVVAGGASVAIGIIDMLRGGYGVLKGRERENLLLEIARDAELKANAPEFAGDVTQGLPQTPEMATAQQEWRGIAITARAAARTQVTRQTAAGMTIGKGALAIAGGALLLASAATPIGWGLLAGAAIVGGVIAAVRYFQRKSSRRKTVIDALSPAIKAERLAWKAKKKEAEDTTTWGTLARREAMRAIGMDPLEAWMRTNGFTNVDHAYARYINDTAQLLYLNAVVNDKPEMVRLVEAIGLRVNKQAQTPTTKTIAAALDK